MSAKLYVLETRAPANRSLVSELEELLAEAKKGQLNGFAYVAMSSGPTFSINALGSAATIPAYALGALKALEDHLFKLM